MKIGLCFHLEEGISKQPPFFMSRHIFTPDFPKFVQVFFILLFFVTLYPIKRDTAVHSFLVLF